jgi:CDP-glucose 4,6-dehydratase
LGIFKDIYRGKTVLITGHTGFKGSWLSIWLKELGAKVVGYSLNPSTSEDNFVLSGLNNRIIDIRGDVRDLDKLKKVFKEHKPEFVFHLAAQPLVRLSYEMPLATYETNVMGTLNVLEAIRASSSVKAGIMITTDKCYENKEQIWGYRETDALGGYDPYSSSKGCAEILIASYRNSYFNPKQYELHQKAIASVRAGNVIGGGDWSKDRLIPDAVRALMNDEPINIRNPHSTRPWQFVLEPLYGYLLLASKMYEGGISYSSAWNFGPNEDNLVAVNKVVDCMIRCWGRGSYKILENDTNLKHEAALLSLDCTKAKTYLNWKPTYDIENALRLTVDWYKHYKEIDVYELCAQQIKNYEQRLS